MKKLMLAACAAVGLLISAQASAQTMYRCGNTFSQQPCGAGSVAIEPSRPVAAPTPKGAASGMSESQRLEGLIAQSQQGRRRQDIRERLIPEADAALTGQRKSCDQQQASMSAARYEYAQNLYGKVHAAQIAAEMAAAASVCDRRDRELKDALDALLKECAEIKCR